MYPYTFLLAGGLQEKLDRECDHLIMCRLKLEFLYNELLYTLVSLLRLPYDMRCKFQLQKRLVSKSMNQHCSENSLISSFCKLLNGSHFVHHPTTTSLHLHIAFTSSIVNLLHKMCSTAVNKLQGPHSILMGPQRGRAQKQRCNQDWDP